MSQLIAAGHQGAPPLPCLRFAYERLSGDVPVISARTTAQLERSLAQADRTACFGEGKVGAGLEWVLLSMLGHYVEGHTVGISARGRTRPPQSLGGWALLLRRQARRWARHDREGKRQQGWKLRRKR